MGTGMIFTILPASINNSFYRQSLKMMGFAFLIVPTSCFIYTQQNQLDLNHSIVAAINLTTYFATFILMVLAFLIMLGKNFSRTIMRLSIATTILFPLPLWISIISKNQEWIDLIMTLQRVPIL